MRISIRGIILIGALMLALLTGLMGGIAAPLSLMGYVLIAVVWLVYNRKLASLGLTSKGWIKSVLWGLTSGMAVAVIVLPIYVYFPQTSDHFLQFPQMVAERTGITSIAIILLLLALGYCVGSFLHELFYRGLLQNNLEDRIGAVGAIMLTAILFSWAHFPEGIYSTVIGLYEGIICGVLLYRRRSIIASWLFRMSHIVVILTVLFALNGVI